jgi:hypothetical protein
MQAILSAYMLVWNQRQLVGCVVESSRINEMIMENSEDRLVGAILMKEDVNRRNMLQELEKREVCTVF